MAHNVVLQLLSSMGIAGLLAYGNHIYASLRCIFRHPVPTNIMLLLSPIALILGSMLDNFVFNIYPMFFYMSVMAIIVKTTKK